MVPGERIELSLCYQNRILNPARLPVPPPRLGKVIARKYKESLARVKFQLEYIMTIF